MTLSVDFRVEERNRAGAISVAVSDHVA